MVGRKCSHLLHQKPEIENTTCEYFLIFLVHFTESVDEEKKKKSFSKEKFYYRENFSVVAKDPKLLLLGVGG